MDIRKIIIESLQQKIPSDLNDNFFRWFGDSKVVDERGQPMICYHGTKKGGFTEFMPKFGYKGKSKQQVDLGSHFSIDKEYAEGYMREKKDGSLYECYLKIESPLYTNQMFWRGDEGFDKLYNFLKELFGHKFKKLFLDKGDWYTDKNGDKQPQIMNLMINAFLIDMVSSGHLYETLIKCGYDGIFHEPYNLKDIKYINKHPKAYIVLTPSQIKSIYNDSSWDINNNNINS